MIKEFSVKSRHVLAVVYLSLLLLVSVSCEYQKVLHHERHHPNEGIEEKRREWNDESEGSSETVLFYSPQELMKEQYEVKKKFNEICGNFVFSDDVQWPASEKLTSQYAAKLFAFDLKDPRDIYDMIFNGKKIETRYWTQMVAKVQPWLILVIVCLAGQCLCCCQVFCIPELKIFRRCCQIDFNKETESTCERNLYFLLILLAGGLIFFFSGWVFMNSDIQISSNQLQCTLLWSQKVLLGVEIDSHLSHENTSLSRQTTSDLSPNNYAVPNSDNKDLNSTQVWHTKYGGIDKIKSQMKDLSFFFDHIEEKESVDKIRNVDVQPFYEEYQKVEQMIPKFYEIHRGQTLKNPNYEENESGRKMTSEFVESIGPIETIGTIGWSLMREISQRKYKIGYLEGAQNQTAKLERNSNEISQKSTEADRQLDVLTFQAHSHLKLADSVVHKFYPYLTLATGLIEKYFEVVMFIVTCGLFGFVFVAWPKYNGCAIFLHLSWYCSTCVLIIGLGICLVLFAIGLILNNGVCKASTELLNDPLYLKKQGIQLSEELSRGLDYCMFKKADKYIFEVQAYIREIDLLEKDILAFNELQFMKQALNGKINYAQNVLQVEKFAAISPATKATLQINEWSDYSLKSSEQLAKGHCSVSRDKWIWADSECTYSTTIDSSQSNYDLGFTVCLRITKSPESFVADRYSLKEFDECNVSIGQAILNRFKAIQEFRNSVQEVFGSILKDLNDYNANVDHLDIDIDKVSSRLKELKEEFSELFKVVTSKHGGLESTLDCSFIRDSVVRAKDAVCIIGLNGMLLYTVFFLASSILLIPFSLIVCLSVTRILPNKEEEIEKQILLQSQQNNLNASIIMNSNRLQTAQNIIGDAEQPGFRRDSLNQSRENLMQQYLQKQQQLLQKQQQQQQFTLKNEQKPKKTGGNVFSSDMEKPEMDGVQQMKPNNNNNNNRSEQQIENSFFRQTQEQMNNQLQLQLQQQSSQIQQQRSIYLQNNENDEEGSSCYHSVNNQF